MVTVYTYWLEHNRLKFVCIHGIWANKWFVSSATLLSTIWSNSNWAMMTEIISRCWVCGPPTYSWWIIYACLSPFLLFFLIWLGNMLWLQRINSSFWDLQWHDRLVHNTHRIWAIPLSFSQLCLFMFLHFSIPFFFFFTLMGFRHSRLLNVALWKAGVVDLA